MRANLVLRVRVRSAMRGVIVRVVVTVTVAMTQLSALGQREPTQLEHLAAVQADGWPLLLYTRAQKYKHIGQ